MAGSSIVDLRKLLAERYPQTFVQRRAQLPTGIPPLDTATGGGLPKGAITEVATPGPSAGSALLIAALLHGAELDRSFVALVDGRDSFDPQPLGNATLRHLLWVRCHTAMEALKAADLLLRDGNFRLVLLDLVLNGADELRKIPQTSWYRLQRLVETGQTALLVLTRHAIISSAQLKLLLDSRWELEDVDRHYAAARFALQLQRVHGGTLQMTGAG